MDEEDTIAIQTAAARFRDIQQLLLQNKKEAARLRKQAKELSDHLISNMELIEIDHIELDDGTRVEFTNKTSLQLVNDSDS